MIFCIAIGAWAMGKPPAAAEVLYIAPNGNDSWSGKLSEPNFDNSDGPLATLGEARIRVREYISDGLSGPLTVLIRGGEYRLDSTIIFGPEDSGTREYPVYYRAFPNETPVFTGGIKLDDWQRCIQNPEGLPEAARGKLYFTDIPEELKGEWHITSLYNGQKLLSRSRSEKLEVSDKHVPDMNNVQPKKLKIKNRDGKPLKFSREFKYNNNDIPNRANPSDIEIVISPRNRWLVNVLPLEKIDSDNNTAYFAIDPTYTPMPDDYYYVENASEYLDKPGEWIFDSEKGRVYIWPDFPIHSSDIRAPYLQEFIKVEGVEDGTSARFIHFEGLTFRHGLRDTWKPGDKGLQHDWEMYDKGNAILRFRHAEDCSVSKCTFETSSGSGVRLDLHAQRIQVADCLIENLGGTGILLSGYGPGLKDENKFNTVTNNYIHHVGTIYKHSAGIFIAQSGHNLISHNTIHELAYNGMIISGCRPHELVLAKPLRNRREWVSSIRVDETGPFIKDITSEMLRNWLEFDVSMIEPLLHSRENRIEYNEIYRTMLELHDGNGIYFSAMGKNNRAVRNYLHDIYNSNGYIRLDDVSGYTIITHNVGVRGSRMMQIKGPGEIRNNFAFDTKLFIARRWSPTEIDNFILYNTPQGKGHFNQNKRFPDVNTIYDFFDRVSNSLVFVENPPDEIKLGHDVIAPDKRGDAEVGMLFADPMFDEDAITRRIFRFKPGSPAPDLGIEPIDLSSAGSTLAKNSFIRPCDNEVVEKVKNAMLCMQRYSWEHGTAMQGMLEIGDTTSLIIMAREAVQRKLPDGRLSMVGSDMNIADPGVNGPGVLAAYKITGNEKYKNAARELYEYLKRPESQNNAGVIFHNNKSKVIFSDNLFMVAPFLAQMGDYDEAMHQIEGIRELLWNNEEKLFHHIRIQETGEFKDRSFWGGGNGWCAAGMAQVIDLLPQERKADKLKLIKYCIDLIDGCIENQLPSGLLYDKITEPNFEETTLPAMLAYTIYSGVNSGWLDSSYLHAAEKMRKAVYANVDEFGLLQNASKAPRFNSPGTSTEGQAFFLMMEGAFRKFKDKAITQ
jgi:rhamnogalacturonyl hydrolase YesR